MTNPILHSDLNLHCFETSIQDSHLNPDDLKGVHWISRFAKKTEGAAVYATYLSIFF